MLDRQISVSAHEIVEQARKFKFQGYRLSTLTCRRPKDPETGQPGDELELLYLFDKDLELAPVKVMTGLNDRVPSLCPGNPGAFLAENELQDHWGLRFDGIEPDFNRTLMLEEEARLLGVGPTGKLRPQLKGED